jgi:hypothetical protein
MRSRKALSKNAHKQQQMLTEDQNDQSIKTLQQTKQKKPPSEHNNYFTLFI